MKQIHGVMACCVKCITCSRPNIQFRRNSCLSYSYIAIAHRTSLWLGLDPKMGGRCSSTMTPAVAPPVPRSSASTALPIRNCLCAICKARWEAFGRFFHDRNNRATFTARFYGMKLVSQVPSSKFTPVLGGPGYWMSWQLSTA
jgi:hypothetical protein